MTQPFPSAPAYYRHSGKVPFAGFLAAAGIVCIAAIVSGALYGEVGFWIQMIPAAKLSFALLILTMLGYGAGLGMLIGLLCKKMRVRNTPVVMLLAFIACVLGMYAAWVVWVYTLLWNRPDLPSIFYFAWPPNLWDVVQWINVKGVWAISGNDIVSGPALWAFWGAELALIVGAVVDLARREMVKTPFCEHCGKWGSTRPLAQLGMCVEPELTSRLLRREFSVVAASEPVGTDEMIWHDLSLEGCADCDTLQCLTVERVVKSLDKKGNASLKRRMLIRRLLLTPEDTVALAQAAAEVKLRAGDKS